MFDPLIEIRTMGDSRGILWKVTLDKKRCVGQIECISSVKERAGETKPIENYDYKLDQFSTLPDDMQLMAKVIESRFDMDATV